MWDVSKEFPWNFGGSETLISWQTEKAIYLFKVNNRNIRNRYEICSKVTIKTPERRQWRCSGVFIVSFKHFLITSFQALHSLWSQLDHILNFLKFFVPC